MFLSLELKDGRLPEGISHRLGFWKAKEIQKFAYPASESILGGILSYEQYEVWVAAVRIVECLFSCGRNGITTEMLSTLRLLIWRHNILTEEVHGGKSCVVSLHSLIHLTVDIERFSCLDNYWCYAFERAVHTYVEISSNNKHLEVTFAKAESQRELLKFLSTENTSECEYHTNSNGCLEQVLIYYS